MLVYLEQTGEELRGMARPGNAGSSTAQDHLTPLDESLAQLPRPSRQHDPERGLEVLVGSHSVAASHGFLETTVSRGMEFFLDVDLTHPMLEAVVKVPAEGWVPAITKEMEEREGANVAEMTWLLDRAKRPDGSRVLVRR